MKRTIAFLTSIMTLMSLTSCSDTPKDDNLAVNNNFSTTVLQETVNTVTTSDITSQTTTSKAESEAVGSTETNNASSVEYEDIEMPAPFENEGGDFNSDFYSTVDLRLGYIDMSFVNIVGVEEFESWLNSTSSSTSELTSVSDVANLYSFIKHFDISNDFVRENLVSMRNGSDDDFSDEEIDLIISGDDEAVAAHFAAETTITKGGDIYSLKWIYYHSPEDYALNGITANELEAILPMFDRITLTDEARQAIEMKISSYAAA